MLDSTREGFIEVNGGKVWYKIVGKGKRIPLIILHGGPGYPHDYLEPLEDLAKDREIIFYDQLGCGNSERPKDNNLWTVERFVGELGQIIKSLNFKNYHLLGHSWGSALATSFALTQPTGLNKLILTGPYLSTSLWEKDAEKLIKQLPKELQQVLNKNTVPGIIDSEEFKKASKEYYDKFVFRLNPIPEQFAKTEKKMNKTIYNLMWGPKEFTSSGTLKSFDLTNQLSKINIPVLLLCGRFDEATPESTDYFMNLFTNAKMSVFENSAHYPFWNDRVSYMNTINNFLENN